MKFLIEVDGQQDREAIENLGAAKVVLSYRNRTSQVFYWKDFRTIAELHEFLVALGRELIIISDGRAMAGSHNLGVANWPAPLDSGILGGLYLD